MRLPVVLGVLFIACLLISIERCSTGADAAASYVEANCDQAISEAVRETPDTDEIDIEVVMDDCLTDYEQSPEYDASIEAFLHMAIFLAATAVFGIGLVASVIAGASRRMVHKE